MDALPGELCVGRLCAFLGVRDRWLGLARASRRWRRLALLSVHAERHLDLTWCTRERELELAAKRLTTVDGEKFASKLEGVGLYGPRVNAALVAALIDRLGVSRLRTIDIESKQVGNSALGLIAACPRLTHLRLNCIKFTDDTLVAIAKSACNSLETVDIAGCARISDEGVMALANYATRLRELSLDMCHRVTDRSVLVLTHRKSESLTRLSVNRCLKISGVALCLLMMKQRRLTVLSFAHCPKVQSNDMYYLDQVTTSWQLREHTPRSTCQLITLNLSGCAGIDDTGIVSLLRTNSHTLQNLNMSSTVSATSKAFAAVARCHELRSLNVSMCRGLRNGDLRAIAVGCRHLKTLSLQGCVMVDDFGLTTLAQIATQLSRLSIEFCYNVTDIGVQMLVEHCPHLIDLNLKACNQLTIATFEAIAKNPRTEAFSWKALYIGACADMETTAAYCSVVKDKFPRCRVHWV